ncbi:Leucine-rich repeat domain superfamily [Sesbania bispinosa]|nr:Leucine-rich repeat domain superfamily [Sesbania bispinosa]
MTACQVCLEWFDIWKHPLTWRTIRLTKSGYSCSNLVEKICCYAIDRSYGEVEDISITNFGSDDLLKYIGDRACHLRRLRLENCHSISGVGLYQLALKLPLLEDIDLSVINTYVPQEVFQAFGMCCPLLEVFKFNKFCLEWDIVTDIVLAVAKAMPKLRHLEIAGAPLIEDELLAILDECPLLQCLDLSMCISEVNMCSSTDKRCRAQITDFRQPPPRRPEW